MRIFSAKTPSIQIDRYVMIIPDEVRPEFYRLFDTIRTELRTGLFPASLIEEATLLGRKYAEAREDVRVQAEFKEHRNQSEIGSIP